MTEREIFFRHMGLPSFNPMALDIVSAEGIWLYGRNGKAYMDMVSGVSVSNIGHRHPKVLEAIQKQAEHYLHLNVYGEFIQSPQVLLAQKLSGLLATPLDTVYFVNSGSEAIEGAMKLAKRFTGRFEFISFKNAYHGSTQGALSILGNENLRNAFRPLLPDIRQLDFNNFEDLDTITEKTACVVCETIQAEAGIILPLPGFLAALRNRCNKTGTLLIIDDVQMGFGRTGKLFSYMHDDILPDILVLAKALGAGLPLGAFISSNHIMQTLAYKPELGHITTFGGHPLSCAAGLAGLDVLLENKLIESVERKGFQIEQRISGHPAIKKIRRAGLMMGIDLANEKNRQKLSLETLHEGIIIDWFLFRSAFRIAPPLTISEEEITEACDRLIHALDRISE